MVCCPQVRMDFKYQAISLARSMLDFFSLYNAISIAAFQTIYHMTIFYGNEMEKFQKRITPLNPEYYDGIRVASGSVP